MVIIYFSDSKYPLAAMAGAIHKGSLPGEGTPELQDLKELPFFDPAGDWEGLIVALGRDMRDNDVYALSVKGEQGMAYRMVESFLGLFDISEREMQLIDSGFQDNILLSAGCFLCRWKPLSKIGMSLVHRGINKEYGKLRQLVADIKAG